MRIAVYSGTIPSTTFIENLIKGLADSGETVLLFGQRKRWIDYSRDNVQQIIFPRYRFLIAAQALAYQLALLLRQPARYKRLREVIGTRANGLVKRMRLWTKYAPVVLKQPDIFHVQWVKSGDEWLFLKDFGIKVVASLRGTHVNTSPVVFPDIAERYRNTFPEYDGFHAVSDALAEEATKYNADASTISTIRPAVSEDLLAADLTEAQVTSRKPLRMVSIGRNHWKKGFRYAIDACAILNKEQIDFEYTIVGAAGSEALMHQCEQLGLNGRVKLAGLLPHHEVLDLYRQADLLVLPSLEEGIANVVLEAMALGCPVLSADCPGMKEVLTDRLNGLLFPVGDSVALAEAMRVFISLTGEKVHSMRMRAWEGVRSDHLLTGQINGMKRFYREVMGTV